MSALPPEASKYVPVVEWLNWATQNPVGRRHKFGNLVRLGCERMNVPQPPLEIEQKLLLVAARFAMNGPAVVDDGPEPRPKLAEPLEPLHVDLEMRGPLITPPPKMLN